MKKITHSVFLLLGLIFLQGCSDYTALEVHGPSTEKLDIVLVPSHFYGQEAGGNPQWIADAEAIRKRLLEHHFWSKYRDKINVYRLDISTGDDFKNYGGSWSPDNETIMAFAHKNFSALDFAQNDQVIFVIEWKAYQKDPIYAKGHTRGDPNIVKLESDHLNSLVHEFGHSFGLLADEYNVNVSIPDWKSTDPNLATLQPGDKCEDKWNDLMNVVIEAPGTKYQDELMRIFRIVGCYDAASPESKAKIFRPTAEVCIMDLIGDEYPFCPVCQRQLVTRLNKYTPSDNNLYDQVETFQIPSKFMAATQNLSLIDFDRTGAVNVKTGLPVSSNPITDIDAPDLGTRADGIYAEAGVTFTSGMILKQGFGIGPASTPNVLGSTATNPKEHALVAGYFHSRRICAIGIYNTGFTAVTLSSYNAAFFQTGSATFTSNADTRTFIGIRATEPIYRFEINAPSATGFSVDDFYFGECPK